MVVEPFPCARRQAIDDPADIRWIENMISAIAGLIAASGGAVAIAGRDLYADAAPARARALTAMYDAGEVVFGYRDARDGAVVNLVVERLAVAGAGAPRECWRAEVFVEEAEGHTLRGALVEREAAALAEKVVAAVSAGLSAPLPAPGAALARALRAP